MKKTLSTLSFILLLTQLHAQKIEFSLQGNSGLFHYSGNGTTSASAINYGTSPFHSYPNYTYGNKNAVSYGFGVQAQYVATWGFIAGLQADYDLLRSKADINAIYAVEPNEANGGVLSSYTIPVKGSSVVEDQFVNVNPYLGYRLPVKK
jgi:hypothetical protein